MFPESFLEYATVIDSTLRDWAGYQIDDLPVPLHAPALIIINAGWEQRTDPNVAVDAICDLLNTYQAS
jgi:hypothetical protein